MHAQACRTASGAGACGAALLEPRLLASVLKDASPRAQRERKKQVTASREHASSHSDPTNQRHNRSASMAPVRMSAGSETS